MPVVPLFALTEHFDQMFSKGYCEEDILDAFLVVFDKFEQDRCELFEKRLQSLKNLSEEWSIQNIEAEEKLDNDDWPRDSERDFDYPD